MNSTLDPKKQCHKEVVVYLRIFNGFDVWILKKKFQHHEAGLLMSKLILNVTVQ